MSEQSRVVVIGGGVIGAACAWYLSESHSHVTIVDRQKFGEGCSHGNCGYVCPSHVLPLAEPGAVKGAVKALFSRNAPFRIKPRFDFSLWSWLLKFSRKCNRKDMLAGGVAIQDMLVASYKLYEELVEKDGMVCNWQKKGLLYVYRSKEKLDAFTPTNQLLTEQFNEPAQRLTEQEILELEPALKPGLAGGWYYEHDAHLRSDLLMDSWKEALKNRGVEFREQCEVTGFSSQTGRATAVKTSTGEIPADQFVVATGAWTPMLRSVLGCPIPIQPGKGYSITMPKPEICPEVPLLFPEHRVGVTPFEKSFRLGSIMEFAGYDSSMKPARLKLLREGAEPYLRQPWAEPIHEQWFGWRPMTYDSLPIIDFSPALKNVMIAAGHNMLGLSMGTGTGKLVADLLSNREPHINPKPYSVSRFR